MNSIYIFIFSLFFLLSSCYNESEENFNDTIDFEVDHYFENYNYALLYNYGTNYCDVCVIEMLERLSYFDYDVKILIDGTMSLETNFYNKFRHMPNYFIKYNVKANVPFFCIIDRAGETQYYFIPNKDMPRLTEEYFKEILPIIKMHNK